jgi:hypothetical protein
LRNAIGEIERKSKQTEEKGREEAGKDWRKDENSAFSPSIPKSIYFNSVF